MIPVAGYCRVSTDKDDQANSFQAQQVFFREYIQQHPDWELYEIYADEGITGTSVNKRAAFQRMLQDAYEGKVKLIITKEISRFSRNILDTLRYTRELKAAGIGVIFLTENIHSLNPEAELLMTFMGTIAQEESRRTSLRVKWGQTRRMEQGIVFGHSLLGYDVKDGKMEINPEGAKLVQLIFHKYGIEKKGTAKICRELEAAGYQTSTGNPVWNPSHILKILQNEKYLGDLVQKKSITPDFLSHCKKTNHGEEEMVYISNHHKPIISRELWDLVQAERERRNKHRKGTQSSSQRHLFSGKIRCGACGANFVSRTKKRKNGSIIRRWSCYNATVKGRHCCDIGVTIRDEDARFMLKTAWTSLKMDTAYIDQVITAATDAIQAGESMQNSIHQTIRHTERKLRLMMDTYFSGEISHEEMLSFKNRYESQLLEWKSQMKNKENAEETRNEIKQILTRIWNCEEDHPLFYRNLIRQITVHRDRHLELLLNNLETAFFFRI